eukprot:TRINITY_DN5150_c0_g1_i2.p1 TRINITY_DN5150_c0_g1~~TRINITY_DN5150_c0_g1_i2.p1  ORF type:complete len:324 (+),score=56.28 TRINITY_DN5150_c0_g1_i2:104-1075(+)
MIHSQIKLSYDELKILHVLSHSHSSCSCSVSDPEHHLPPSSHYGLILSNPPSPPTSPSAYTSHIVNLLDWFTEEKAIFSVFEKGDTSLWDYLGKSKKMCLHDIQQFGREVLSALADIHDKGITHADLKPENVVFFPRKYPIHYNYYAKQGFADHLSETMEAKLIDFGSSVFDYSHHSDIIGTRAYSGPEILLAQGWAQPLDIWALACVMLDMYLGYTLFACSDDLDQLYLFERVLGPIPSSLVDKTRTSIRNELYDHNGIARPPLSSNYSLHSPLRLKEMIHQDDQPFYELISSMLQYFPEERPTAHSLLSHDFFNARCYCCC